MAERKTKRGTQHVGYVIGIGAGVLCVVVLSMPAMERFLAHGPMNVGHEGMPCEYCHVKAPGTVRQQLQANTAFLLGRRRTPVDFGYQDVTNDACLECHARPNDRHPVFRFFEPRFKKARANLRPQYCVSCHLEHTGKRVTLAAVGYCRTCHEDTALKNDPLDISHSALIDAENWESCLGCHDFHGNHIMKTKTLVDERYPPAQVRAYFDGAESPYPETKHYKAKSEPDHD